MRKMPFYKERIMENISISFQKIEQCTIKNTHNYSWINWLKDLYILLVLRKYRKNDNTVKNRLLKDDANQEAVNNHW